MNGSHYFSDLTAAIHLLAAPPRAPGLPGWGPTHAAESGANAARLMALAREWVGMLADEIDASDDPSAGPGWAAAQVAERADDCLARAVRALTELMIFSMADEAQRAALLDGRITIEELVFLVDPDQFKQAGGDG